MNMATNSFVYSQLPKRRRRSTPTSPLFPSDKPDAASYSSDNAETPSSPKPQPMNPSNERVVPVSRFLIPPFAETAPIELRFNVNTTAPARYSEEQARRKPSPSPSPEPPRPSTSTAANWDPCRQPKLFALSPTVADTQKHFPDQPASLGRQTPTQSPKLKQDSVYRENEVKNNSTLSLSSEKASSDDTTGQKSARFGKGRLNMLNPKSLLARRRASHNHIKPDDLSIIPGSLTVPALPDCDPRIRGKFVHDFSAPRARRIPSYQDGISAENSPVTESRPSHQTGRRASELTGLGEASPERNIHLPHSPPFKKHFNDDRQTLQPGNKGYLHSLNAPSRPPDTLNPSFPAVAKQLPAVILECDDIRDTDMSTTAREAGDLGNVVPPSVPPKAAIVAGEQPGQSMPVPTHPPPPPPVPPKPVTDDMTRDVLPKHMTSTSSRFSFQLGGMDSAAQERLLEEKHKEQAARKKNIRASLLGEEDQGDGFDDYDIGGDFGLEEKIPGINADLEDEEEAEDNETEASSLQHATTTVQFAAFRFTPSSAALTPTSTTATSQPTPRDELGQVIGFANTTDSPHLGMPPQFLQFDSKDYQSALFWDSLGISSVQCPLRDQKVDDDRILSSPENKFDDDLYFDDGNFDDLPEPEPDHGFDEAIFDDESGKLRDIPAENQRRLEAAQQKFQKLSTSGSTYSTDNTSTSEVDSSMADSRTRLSRLSSNGVENDSQPARSKVVSFGPLNDHSNGLTESNLAAYHDALAMAAHEAHAQGRFNRRTTPSQDSDDRRSRSPAHRDQLGIVSNDGRLDPNYDGFGEDGGFNFDDDMDDDTMIAEANAEVLENDDEGFYSQEFGFYARAPGKGDCELVNGGYFGPRGGDGVKRSHSGRGKYQEPSLTPITEISEWSTRNSVVSLPIPGGLPLSAQSAPSPGIAQLLDIESSDFDEDEALSQLIKLRRGAWGGSSSSINSLGGSHASNSPLIGKAQRDLGPAAPSNLTKMPGGHKMTSSLPSLPDSSFVGITKSDEDALAAHSDEDERQTLTAIQNTPKKQSVDLANSALAQSPPTTQNLTRSPISAGSDKARVSGHSRASSGAESISYLRDPEGSGRWVLERRRTGDDGEGEVVEREFVAAAGI